MPKRIVINEADYTAWFPKTGYSVGYQSIQGANAGVMLDGSYTEDEVAIKAIITLPCMPLDEKQLSELLSNIYSFPYADITYFDPKAGAERNIEARRSVSAQKYRGFGADGKEYWTGTVVTFTER